MGLVGVEPRAPAVSVSSPTRPGPVGRPHWGGPHSLEGTGSVRLPVGSSLVAGPRERDPYRTAWALAWTGQDPHCLAVVLHITLECRSQSRRGPQGGALQPAQGPVRPAALCQVHGTALGSALLRVLGTGAGVNP